MVLKPSRAIAYLRGARPAELSLRLSLRMRANGKSARIIREAFRPAVAVTASTKTTIQHEHEPTLLEQKRRPVPMVIWLRGDRALVRASA
jgi:hypothetical protein